MKKKKSKKADFWFCTCTDYDHRDNPECVVHGDPDSKTLMSLLGRIGGSKTSPRKAKASRKNGKLGGRPKSKKS